MSSDHPAIRASNLSKCYQLYEKPGHRLQQFFVPRLDRALGRDPKNYFKEFWALRDVSFEVARGETVGIVGRNGSGKSTLLQLLCGTLTPTGGSVEIDGRIAALLELGAGFNPEFTGRENVFLNGAVLGMSHEQIVARFDDIAAFADIGEFMDQPLKTYSSGMSVRLAFSVATYADADILVIDEALSVGDFAFQAKCMRRLHRFIDDGGTLLFVSHDIVSVKKMCSRSIYLRHGEMRALGPSEQVCEQYLAETNRDEGLAGTAATHLKTAAGIDAPGALAHGLSAESVEEFRRRVRQYRRHVSQQCEFVSAVVKDAAGRAITMAEWGQTVSVEAGLRVNEPIHNLVIAFYMRDRLQVDVMGTNTEYEDVKLSDLMPGELVNVTFTFANYLKAGEYGVCLIAGDKSIVTSKYFDWIDLAASLKTSDRRGQVAWAAFNPAIEAKGVRVASR